eukprot:9512901-Lingulodinium_polyedra.AAC.1
MAVWRACTRFDGCFIAAAGMLRVGWLNQFAGPWHAVLLLFDCCGNGVEMLFGCCLNAAHA